MALMRLRTALAAASALIAGGCGSSAGALSAACTQGPSALSQALDTAPDRVALPDGTRLSDCVRRADANAEIQEVAAGATPLADRLATESKGSEAAAVRLGYLIGAARRGARHTGGIHAELLRRLERAAATVPAARRAALRRGLAAGERAG
jgi:urease alpha subunit